MKIAGTIFRIIVAAMAFYDGFNNATHHNHETAFIDFAVCGLCIDSANNRARQ